MYRPRTEDLRLPAAGELDGIRDELITSGHKVLQQFAEPALLAALRDEAARLPTELAGHPEGTSISRDASGRVLSMHYLDRHSALLFDLIRLAPLIEMAETLLESRCVPFLTEYFAKPAVRSEATPPHQDQIFYRDHFGDEQAITFWIALTDVGENDGVLQYSVPQPKPGELLKHRTCGRRRFHLRHGPGSRWWRSCTPFVRGASIRRDDGHEPSIGVRTELPAFALPPADEPAAAPDGTDAWVSHIAQLSSPARRFLGVHGWTRGRTSCGDLRRLVATSLTWISHPRVVSCSSTGT
jgi:hypothetical protein